RFGETVLPLRDPDGMRLELVASKAAEAIPGWANGDIPAEHAIRGFAGVTLWVGAPEPTAEILTSGLGFAAAGSEDARHRFVSTGAPLGTTVDLRAAPGFLAGRQGKGTIHHVAFRAESDAAQAAMAKVLAGQGMQVTDQKDRNYFRSVYFREPSGVLLEIATDDPGFAVDEPKATLGTAIKLPRWYEPRRGEIEAALPALV
ncbi:MAG: ring-cleaving dioxygenase, partial [Bauldia sp.]